jgi:Family of unknown function (DUF5723)/F plasmid transfer operon, TraF, protein
MRKNDQKTGRVKATSMRPSIMTLMFWIIIAAAVALLALNSANATSSARSLAMGGAYTALAKGAEAALYNPANLGLRDHRQTGIHLAGLGADVNNNAFSLNDYNSYTGQFLTDADKTDILGKIPDEGLKLRANVDAWGPTLSLGSMVFSGTVNAAADANLSKDIIDLVLNGNQFGQTISLTGSYSEALAYATAGLSYGTTIHSIGSRQLAVGATLKYLRGLGIERILENEGSVTTGEFGFQGDGQLAVQTASGGSGYAVDLGAAVKLSKAYTAGLCVKNIISTITWDKTTEEHGFLFAFDTLTLDNMDQDFVVSDDYSIPISSFKTSLPPVASLGLAKTTGSIVWGLDWEQGLKSQPGTSTKPRLSAGVEWSPIGILPLRAGYSTGGSRNSGVSFGAGLAFAFFNFDVAAVAGSGGTMYSAKGITVAVSTGLTF